MRVTQRFLGGTRRILPLTLAAALVVSGLAGCGTDKSTTPAGDPYAAEYQQAIDATTSEFVKSVLSDHDITDAELSEAQDSLIACLRDQGFEPLVTTESGRREIGIPSDAGWECVDEWMGPIQGLYDTIKANPNNENMYDLVAVCLARLELVPPEFTGSDLEELDKQAEGSFTVNMDGTKSDEVLPENPNPTLPSGMALRAPETMGCWTSPLTTGL